MQDKTILITGGTSGVGLEIVKKLAANNQVIVICRKGTLPEGLLQGKYPVEVHHANLGRKKSLEAAANNIRKKYRHLDVLINNAAIQNTPALISDNFNYDDIEHEINTNFTAICQLTSLCIPLLRAARDSIILNVNSGLAIAPKRESAIYCATKSALNSFSISLSYQLEKTNIEVKQVFLPLVETPMTTGRGKGKLQASDVADKIIRGIDKKCRRNDVGKVKLLRLINYLLPPLAARIVKEG